jgi:beta-glucanase (GH16 family)
MSDRIRRLSSACAILVLALSPAVGQSGDAGPLNHSGLWTRVFTEEFDDSALDEGKWVTCYWWSNTGCTNLSNNELQWYVPENAMIAGGALRLRALKGAVIGHEEREFPYTSGMVTSGRKYGESRSDDRFSLTYGYVEVRAKVPAGQGLWPAVWLLPSDQRSTPEIDVMETLGHQPNVLEMHYHYEDADGEKRNAGHDVTTVDLSLDWHVYGVEWGPEAIIWYLDGVERWRYVDRATISDEPMYVLMNLAVGGNWPGDPDQTTIFPADFLIDYVRVWQDG